jgi:hypothetical protein
MEISPIKRIYESGGFEMSIQLIGVIAIVVISIGVKLHRGSFFWWSKKKDAPEVHTDGRDADDFR